MSNLKIYNFYRFIELSNKQSLKYEIEELVGKFTIRGTILLADEGINGSISGKESDLNYIVKFIMFNYNTSNLNSFLILMGKSI